MTVKFSCSDPAVHTLIAFSGAMLLPYGFHNVLLSMVTFVIGVGGFFYLLGKNNRQVGRVIRVVCILLAAALIWLKHGSLTGLDAAVDILIAAFYLKMLEIRRRQDMWLLVYVGFVVLGAALLLHQGIGWALLALIGFILLVNMMIRLSAPTDAADNHSSKQAVGLVVFSIPLMLLAFLIVPRLDPFWSLPSFDHKTKTGISGRMAPGSFDELVESEALAFRVRFEGKAPEKFYWRVVVMEDFDGVEWKPSITRDDVKKQDGFPQYTYSVLQEPSGYPWLVTLGPVWDASEGYGVQQALLRVNKPIDQRFQYQVVSQGDDYWLQRLTQQQRQRNLHIPEGSNPRIRAYGKQLRQSLSSDQSYVLALLTQIHQSPFFYSHSPPEIGKHGADDFWFGTKEGLCEHYAQAFTLLLRAAGIPARVVTGYYGGDKNEEGGFYSIREKHAHAWVEAQLDGKPFWKRLDPTFAVSPERNKVLKQQSTDDKPLFISGSLGYWQTLDQSIERITFWWQTKVVQFDNRLQKQVLSSWLGGFAYWKILALIVGLLGSMAILALFKSSRQVEKDPVNKPQENIFSEGALYQRLVMSLQLISPQIKLSNSPKSNLDAVENVFVDRFAANYLVHRVRIADALESYHGYHFSPSQFTCMPYNVKALLRRAILSSYYLRFILFFRHLRKVAHETR